MTEIDKQAEDKSAKLAEWLFDTYTQSLKFWEDLTESEKARWLLDADLCLAQNTELSTAESDAERFRVALEKINDVRNSIIGTQKLNWSEHVYPLVAALTDAGFEGMHYPEARKYFGTLVERAVKAENELEAIRAANATSDAGRMREAILGAIEALERNSTSAPVVECLKAALSPDAAPVAADGAVKESEGRGLSSLPLGESDHSVTIGSRPSDTNAPVAEIVEDIAQWLHDETKHPDSYPDYTWPETDRDDGQRNGGFVKIVPLHAQEYFRDIARRLVARLRKHAPVAEAGAVAAAFIVHDDPELGDYLTRSEEAAKNSGFGYTPLYAHPQPAAAVDAEAGLRAAKEVAVAMRDKYGSPTGDAYSCGIWDQSQRIIGKIDAILALIKDGSR